MHSHRLQAYLLLLIVSLIWGAAGPVIKFTLGSFPPLIFLSYRFAISSFVALVYFASVKPRLPRRGKQIAATIGYSLLAVTFALGFLFFGFNKTTSLTGTLLSSLAPLVTVVTCALLLKEHVTRIERLGIGIAFAGTILTIFGPLLGNGVVSGPNHLGSLEGNALIVASLLVDALGALLVKVVVRDGISPAMLTHLSFTIGFVTIAPVALSVYSLPTLLQQIATAPLTAHVGVWYMALLSGTLAYFLRNQAVKSIEVSEVAVFAYLYPLWAAPLAVFWLGEKITPLFLVGAAIIALGVVLAEHKRRQRRH